MYCFHLRQWTKAPGQSDLYITCFPLYQVLARVFSSYCHLGYDLLELLTKVNELLMNEANRASLAQVPYLTHTLRAKLCLGEKLLLTIIIIKGLLLKTWRCFFPGTRFHTKLSTDRERACTRNTTTTKRDKRRRILGINCIVHMKSIIPKFKNACFARVL